MIINHHKIKQIKKTYKTGTKIILDHMEDIQAIPQGTKGTVMYVDDIGQIHVNWENGSGLALIHGVDEFHIIQ
ncbi:DUF4314 domain-containing protein [Methanosphaera sp. ISO3-F5]|uniref:DUF4314 domain-containing protein n=1 Tax=Methanosphaera sp. ISO3-F5 TaxID=1452353 RepID=UPI002B259831|nr:DUF4314 domain-containing protein [Methanosphaera sp. ISO3-F5]WQH64065.1 DUF4314 domain-containing protein [Methanosphaera sp. ISO3-F5]